MTDQQRPGDEPADVRDFIPADGSGDPDQDRPRTPPVKDRVGESGHLDEEVEDAGVDLGSGDPIPPSPDQV